MQQVGELVQWQGLALVLVLPVGTGGRTSTNGQLDSESALNFPSREAPLATADVTSPCCPTGAWFQQPLAHSFVVGSRPRRRRCGRRAFVVIIIAMLGAGCLLGQVMCSGVGAPGDQRKHRHPVHRPRL